MRATTTLFDAAQSAVSGGNRRDRVADPECGLAYGWSLHRLHRQNRSRKVARILTVLDSLP